MPARLEKVVIFEPVDGVIPPETLPCPRHVEAYLTSFGVYPFSNLSRLAFLLGGIDFNHGT